MAQQQITPSVPSLKEERADHRLPFVSFALLILVIGPIITGALINFHQCQLLVSVEAAQQQLAHVRKLIQLPRVRPLTSTPALPPTLPQRRDLDAALTTAEEAQIHAEERIAYLHDIQVTVVTTFALLGLVAAFYSGRALRQLRRLAEANGRRAQALESLFETAGHLSVSASPEAMHEHLTERVARVVQANRAELWSYDPARQALSPLRPAFGFPAELSSSVQVPIRTGEWVHDLLFHNDIIRSNDMAQTAGSALHDQLRAWKVSGGVIVPLIAHNQPVGILCAYDKQSPAPFTEEDVRILRTFATQAAFVLHSAHQYANARDRGEHLAVLARLTQVINSSLELDTIVPTFLREAHALVPYRRARLALRPAAIETESWSQEYPEADAEETDLLRRLRGKARQKSSFSAAGHTATAANPDAAVPPKDADGKELPHLLIWTLDWHNVDSGSVASAPQWLMPEPEDILWKTMETGQPHHDGMVVIPLIVHGEVLGALEFAAGNDGAYDEHQLLLAQQAAGQLAGAVKNARLYQEATHRAEQLEWSMQETHHRIKNNLQAVMSILDLYIMEADGSKRQSGTAEQKSRQETVAREGLSHAMREVSTIAAVHDLLSEDMHNNRVHARHLIERLIPLLVSGPLAAGKHLHVETHADDLMLPSKLASALALAANELIVNAVRHGGSDRSELTLHVHLHLNAGQLSLQVSDDGPGYPADFDVRKHAKIGLDLARMMIERDLRGTLTFENQREPGHGATALAHVPYKETFSRAESFKH